MRQKFINFCHDLVYPKFLFGARWNKPPLPSFDLFHAFHHLHFALDKVVIENFFLDEIFAIMHRKQFF